VISGEKAAMSTISTVALGETDVLRRSGLETVGDVPWGTHFCQFYETADDLIDVLVPYFRAGLEDNEFCMWVTSEPLSREEAENAMRKAVPDFAKFLKRGQMEIVPHGEWYLKNGAFDLQRVLDGWIGKLDEALAKGYDGIRVTGNTAWLEKKDWKDFADYEEKVNSVIGKNRMIAVCTYSISKCGAAEAIDVIRNHQFALIRREGKWELIESSEIKQAKEALRASEEKFRSIYEGASDAMVYLDKSGKILDVNKKAVELFGGSKEELLGKHFAKVGVISVRELQTLMSAFAKVLAGKQVTADVCIKNRKGREICLECSASLMKIHDRHAILLLARDTTERKRTEEELIRLSSAVKMSTDSIVIGDLNAKIIAVNEAALKMYGTDDKMDLIGRNSFDLIVPEEREKALAGMKEVLEKGYHKGLEYHVITKNGTRIPVEMSVALMKDADGKPIGFVSISRDITDRKKMEEKLNEYSKHLEEMVQKKTGELLESEKRYSVLVEEASDGVAIIQDGKIIFANKKALEIVGYSRDEQRKVPFEILVDEKYRQHVNEFYMKTLRGEVPTTSELELIVKTGEHVPIEITGTPIKYQGRLAVLIIIRDIRERKRMEEQRLRLGKLETMSEVATMVAHDLRNPLTSIRNACFYIRNTCPARANAECKSSLEMLEIIEKETLAASSIINELLDFSARRLLQKKEQNINNLIDDSLTRIDTPENIRIEKKYAKKAIAAIDEKQLERVIINLTKNAVQAMPNGGTLTITTKETKDHVEIAFTDTGTGIQEENMKKLFTPLFTTKAKGIGMGLAICKKIVEQHGGTIEAQSKAGQGTTFTIKLPKKQEENTQ
jgi:PAS domain S-box-containing protein